MRYQVTTLIKESSGSVKKEQTRKGEITMVLSLINEIVKKRHILDEVPSYNLNKRFKLFCKKGANPEMRNNNGFGPVKRNSLKTAYFT